MTDHGNGREIRRGRNRRPRRRGLDVLTFLAGLIALGVAGYNLTDGALWVPDWDLRWVLAGGAVAVGVLILVASLRPRRK
ncbi:hypothetical protein LX15_003874 [Streptoalloteichus tenebrarius]|uniref:Integral membrane protein n=1 Tax=Streptoalloteichus tenebrarius (strain ATCC 17920 / DSM 40477 / JCM 4838 / CBS 697.72 / NBRC 16177 / NCIMB 11028 / NRRL B-12390 / A12253. 1 / ISP 5477) TaxID=1933 RepID=A0ABT1HXB4_STRSD|nr:hypothetical protein [Streptoalloteichus tenebrarius]MCP2260161.1 hypothetical protein [Streptoalloteichus tenebrarius]BFF02632.1 hypothetical protein GCM10020241_43070 [Streptoalloteichus tenebrarius]